MKLTIKLFASLRAKHGPSVQIILEPPATVDDLQRELRAQGYWTQGSRVAVNLKFALPDEPLHPSDEIAVIPPASGG